MRKFLLALLTTGACAITVNAQELFTYGTHPVSKEEFLRVYKKNSISKKPDMTDTALRSYLDLYGLFRMKVAEADRQHLDTITSIQKELDSYRRQLAKNYLTDEQVTNKLIHEAYDRMKENVHMAHILVACAPGSDTTVPHARIDSIYKAIVDKKADFETMAREFSDDKGSKDNGGDVGYFTALQTVYSIENVAFTTPVGKISKPFRSQFGYHIIKVLDKRADRGQVKVAQILIQVSKSKGAEGIAAGKRRADSVEALLKSGVPFDELVQKYSDDQYSIKDNGVMKPFGVGKMVMPFENAAFALKNPGDISEPIKTDYGFHIIKLIEKKPLPPYDTLFPTLKHRVENDSRAQTAKEIFFNKVKEKNGFKEYADNIKEINSRFMGIPDSGANAKIVKAENYATMNKPVFVLGGKSYLQHDYAKFFETLTHGKITGPKQAVIHDAYNLYVNTVVNDFEEHKLVEENPDFRNLMEEYRDGIMLFELMDRNVWSKAAHDTVGLEAFYAQHKSKYMWEPGFEGAVYKFKTRALRDTGILMLKSGNVKDEEIVKAINTPQVPDGVSIQRGRYEFSHFKDATMAELQANPMKVLDNSSAQGGTTGFDHNSGGPFSVVVAREVYSTPGQKSLSDARGYVVAEYQDYLEKQWNEKMRKEYPMKVNEKVFKSMVNK